MLDAIKNIEVETVNGDRRTVGSYGGDLLLVVNTASRCGFTPQLKGLQELHRDYEAQGLRILAFPSNQFAQELPTGEEVASFCEIYSVSFPLHAITPVNGRDAHPLFKILTEKAPGLMGVKRVKWNFTKFLVDLRTGSVQRFAPSKEPERLRSAIDAALRSKAA